MFMVVFHIPQLVVTVHRREISQPLLILVVGSQVSVMVASFS